MELAKVTTRGQITIPAAIRKKLSVKDGDKVIFIEENGRIVMENSAMATLKKAQDAFTGEFERLGLKTEQDVVFKATERLLILAALCHSAPVSLYIPFQVRGAFNSFFWHIQFWRLSVPYLLLHCRRFYLHTLSYVLPWQSSNLL